MIRPLTAFLLASAVLHLNVARADAVCQMRGHDAPATSHEGMHHDASAPAEEAPSGTPISSDSCPALLSCAAVLSVSDGPVTLDTPFTHVVIAAAVVQLPLSRSTAPEPPPPKA